MVVLQNRPVPSSPSHFQDFTQNRVVRLVRLASVGQHLHHTGSPTQSSYICTLVLDFAFEHWIPVNPLSGLGPIIAEPAWEYKKKYLLAFVGAIATVK